jgi:hypothetical protein
MKSVKPVKVSKEIMVFAYRESGYLAIQRKYLRKWFPSMTPYIAGIKAKLAKPVTPKAPDPADAFGE